jgi:hypothetical protein
MPKQKKTWILVKGTEYNPGGCISLGQILVKPFEPSIPLLPDGPLPIPESHIERSHQSGVEIVLDKYLDGSFQIWCKLDLLPVEGDLGAHGHKSETAAWKFDRLESEIMVPRISHVRAALVTEGVTAQIKRSKFNFKKRLYMVTGVRIARGAKLTQSVSHSIGGNAKVLVDLTTFGAPAKVGPEGSLDS